MEKGKGESGAGNSRVKRWLCWLWGEKTRAWAWGQEGGVPEGTLTDTPTGSCCVRGARRPGGCPPKDGTSTQRRGACAEEDELPCLPRWSVEPSFVAPKPPQTLALGIRSSCWLGSKEWKASLVTMPHSEKTVLFGRRSISRSFGAFCL